jgi:hypothetical protein
MEVPTLPFTYGIQYARPQRHLSNSVVRRILRSITKVPRLFDTIVFVDKSLIFPQKGPEICPYPSLFQASRVLFWTGSPNIAPNVTFPARPA